MNLSRQQRRLFRALCSCGIGVMFTLAGCGSLVRGTAPLAPRGGPRLTLAPGESVPVLELPPDAGTQAPRGTGLSPEVPGGYGMATDQDIADVLTIPQSMALASRNLPSDAISMACQKELLAQFRTSHFAPWLRTTPLFDTEEAAAVMRTTAGETWFGENRRHLPEKLRQELLASCDLEHFPSLNLAAIAVQPAFLRVLPTMKPFYRAPLTGDGTLAPDELSFDRLQNTEIKINEPLRLLHVSADGAWAFVESSFANGWVEASAVRQIDPRDFGDFMALPKVVVTRDFPVIHDHAGNDHLKPKVGTLFPVMGEMGDRYLVLIAANTGSPVARLIPAALDRSAAKPFPLTFTQEHVALVGDELLGRPYGWGDAYHDRDCSGTTRDFFLTFGIWLPRNSAGQIAAGPRLSLAGMTADQKARTIRENGVPFLTLLHLDGHIMLYSGMVAGKPTIFHSPWGVSSRGPSGGSVKRIIGKSVITSLEPGKELPLAGPTYLERLTAMRRVTDVCRQPGLASPPATTP